MKRLVYVISFVVAAMWSMTALAAGTIGVVDMQKVFHSSPQVQTINKNLTSQFSSRKESIVKQSQALEQQIQNYQKNKTVMTKSQAQKSEQDIAKKEAALRAAQVKFQQDLFAEQNKKMTDFLNKVKTTVAKIARRKNLTMVLPKNSVLYSQGVTDITGDVLSALK